MVKLVFSLRRRPEMTREEFQAYWRDRHAPLVARHSDALRIRRYVQTHAGDTELDDALSGPRESEPHHYDGVAELWFDSMEEAYSRHAAKQLDAIKGIEAAKSAGAEEGMRQGIQRTVTGVRADSRVSAL